MHGAPGVSALPFSQFLLRREAGAHNRQGLERGMVDVSQIGEHMEVVGSDGQHVGTVDKLVIKLTKKDPAAQGQHHIINLDAVQSVQGGKLVLNVPASEAAEQEKTVQG